MPPRPVLAFVVVIPILILAVLVGGWTGLILVAIFVSILVAIVIDQ